MIKRLCAVLCGIALTWTCAAFGLFVLTADRCTLRTPKSQVARARVREIEDAVSHYRLARGQCPPTSDDLFKHTDVNPSSLLDPWGTSIPYWCSDDGAEAISAGPDRIFGTADDITATPGSGL
jgi:hypothetical protein